MPKTFKIILKLSRNNLRKRKNSIRKRKGNELKRKKECKNKKTLTRKTRNSWTNSWNWFTDTIIKWVKLTKTTCFKSKIEKPSSILFRQNCRKELSLKTNKLLTIKKLIMMSTVMTSKTIMRCILMKKFTTKRNQRLNMLFKNQISMEQSTIDKIWVSFMVIISKCKIIVKPSQKESLNIHLLPILVNMRKKFITLSLKRSLNNLKTSFRPERVHQSGKFIQLRDVNPTVDASTRNLFQMLHLSGLINLERNWKIRLTADLKGTGPHIEAEWLTPKQSTKMPT